MSSSTVPPPKPDIVHCFHNGSPYPALLHMLLHLYFVIPIIPSMALNVIKPISNIFSFHLLKPGSLLKPFPSFPFIPHFPFIFPSYVLPCSIHPPSNRLWVSGSHRTALVQWAVPCFCASSTQLLCLPMRLASWTKSPCPG